MLIFSSGLITMGFLVACLFFVRFWLHTGDRLFVLFACAFLLFAINQGLVTLAGVSREEMTWFYLLRLAGFLLIILAIVRKNVTASRL